MRWGGRGGGLAGAAPAAWASETRPRGDRSERRVAEELVLECGAALAEGVDGRGAGAGAEGGHAECVLGVEAGTQQRRIVRQLVALLAQCLQRSTGRTTRTLTSRRCVRATCGSNTEMASMWSSCGME